MFIGYFRVPNRFAAAFGCANRLSCRFVDVDPDQIAWSDLEQPQAGPKGGGQAARSKMTCVVPSRYGVFSWVAPAHPCARDTCASLHIVSDVAVQGERQALFRDGRPADGRFRLPAFRDTSTSLYVVATQPLELLALIRSRRHAGMQGQIGRIADLRSQRLPRRGEAQGRAE
jgi:hypothetical protein